MIEMRLAHFGEDHDYWIYLYLDFLPGQAVLLCLYSEVERKLSDDVFIPSEYQYNTNTIQTS